LEETVHESPKTGDFKIGVRPVLTRLWKERMFHWKFNVEQKEEVRRAMAVRVPKEVILSYFYPETPVVRMMEIRRRYE